MDKSTIHDMTQNKRRVSGDLVQNGKCQRVEYSKMFILKRPTPGHQLQSFFYKSLSLQSTCI